MELHDDIRVLCGLGGSAGRAGRAGAGGGRAAADEPPAGVRRARAAAAATRVAPEPRRPAPPPDHRRRRRSASTGGPAPVAPSPAVTRGARRAPARARWQRRAPPLPVTQLDAPSAFAAPSAFSERAPARSARPSQRVVGAAPPEPVAAGHPNHRHPTPDARRELFAGPVRDRGGPRAQRRQPQRRALALRRAAPPLRGGGARRTGGARGESWLCGRGRRAGV